MAYFDELADIDALVAIPLDDSCGKMVLAMAYVPVQEWGDLYDEGVALSNGTLIPDLNLPFTGRKQVRNG